MSINKESQQWSLSDHEMHFLVPKYFYPNIISNNPTVSLREKLMITELWVCVMCDPISNFDTNLTPGKCDKCFISEAFSLL